MVVVIMCIGLYGMAVAKRTGRKRRRGRPMKAPRHEGVPKPMEVWNANVYFDDMSGAKNRPVIVLEKRDDEYTILMITSSERMPGRMIKLDDPYEVMLDKTSSVRVDRLFRIPPSKFNYKLGDLCESATESARSTPKAHNATHHDQGKARGGAPVV